jgi:hypothetical protein
MEATERLTCFNILRFSHLEGYLSIEHIFSQDYCQISNLSIHLQTINDL